MEKPKSAAFKFVDFHIPKFSFNDTKSESDSLQMDFKPSGIYNQESGEFKLLLIFTGFEDRENGAKEIICKLDIVSTFKFDDGFSFNDIPDYFYSNSVAIIFPFIRSFLASITLQANAKMILLNLMNLNAISSVLKENSSVK